jgi:hypothetical protein
MRTPPRDLGKSLAIGAFFLLAASLTAAQEPATSTGASNKVKTSDKQQAAVLEFVKGREAPPGEVGPTGPKAVDLVAAPRHGTDAKEPDQSASNSRLSGGRFRARSKIVEPGADIEQLTMIVMMESAKSENKDLSGIMERIHRLNLEKQEVRDSLSVMWQEQSRLRDDPNAKAEQLEWAYSLIKRCPPVSNDDCLTEQLRSRASVLKTSPVSGDCPSPTGCARSTLTVSEDPDAGGEASPPKQ